MERNAENDSIPASLNVRKNDKAIRDSDIENLKEGDKVSDDALDDNGGDDDFSEYNSGSDEEFDDDDEDKDWMYNSSDDVLSSDEESNQKHTLFPSAKQIFSQRDIPKRIANDAEVPSRLKFTNIDLSLRRDHVMDDRHHNSIDFEKMIEHTQQRRFKKRGGKRKKKNLIPSHLINVMGEANKAYTRKVRQQSVYQ